MDINFELILLLLIGFSGLVIAIDHLFLARKRRIRSEGQESVSLPLLIEYSRSLFPILLLVFLLRAFVVEPFRIPSGSLEPTLVVGDFVLVNKYRFGLRLPLLRYKMITGREPKRGRIVVFHWPPDPSKNYIKRLIGLPGDHIRYVNKVLYVNGKVAPQKFIRYTTDSDGQGHSWKVAVRQEKFAGVTHKIFVRPDVPGYDFDITVPPGKYFAMGDNRDDSSDSRFWGFVPERNLVGPAFVIWLSWNGVTDSVRWRRLGKFIH